jgi:CheY-like chemotaxis protein
MSKLLIEMMGGVIGVESTVGEGSVFWFELDSAAPPRLALEPDGPAAALGPIDSSAPVRTIIYVEDNMANLQLVEQLIARRPDLLLLSAGTGKLGIELARAHQPEVILMDINLPGINGIQALEILQADPLTAHIPVLAISANAMIGDIKTGLDLGFFQYLTKPIKVETFMAAVDAALEYAAAHPAPGEALQFE